MPNTARYKLIGLVCMFAIAGRLHAQRIPAQMASLGVGTSGIGGEYRHMMNDWLGLKANISYLWLDFNFDGQLLYQNVVVDPVINFGQVSLLADFFPFTRQRNGVKERIPFRLNAGVSFRTNGTYEARSKVNESFNLGEFQLTDNDLGYIDIHINTRKVLPYMGGGYDFRFKGSPIGLGIEAGTWYHGKPDVTMDATGILYANAENAEQLEKNLSSYRWYPDLKFKINYTIKK